MNNKYPKIKIRLERKAVLANKIGNHLCVHNGKIHCLRDKAPLFEFLEFDSTNTAASVAQRIDQVFGKYLNLLDNPNHRMNMSKWTVDGGVLIWHWVQGMIEHGGIIDFGLANSILALAEQTYEEEYYPMSWHRKLMGVKQ